MVTHFHILDTPSGKGRLQNHSTKPGLPRLCKGTKECCLLSFQLHPPTLFHNLQLLYSSCHLWQTFTIYTLKGNP